MPGTKPGLDVILALGGPKHSEGPSEAESYKEDGPELPPEYVAAFRDYKLDPTPENFWSAVEACVSAKDEKVASDEKMKYKKKAWPGEADNFYEQGRSKED